MKLHWKYSHVFEVFVSTLNMQLYAHEYKISFIVIPGKLNLFWWILTLFFTLFLPMPNITLSTSIPKLSTTTKNYFIYKDLLNYTIFKPTISIFLGVYLYQIWDFTMQIPYITQNFLFAYKKFSEFNFSTMENELFIFRLQQNPSFFRICRKHETFHSL